MIWLLFTGKIRKAFKIPKLFTVFKEDESGNGQMFKFMTCSIILLLLSLGGLGCVAIIASPITAVVQTAQKAVQIISAGGNAMLQSPTVPGAFRR